MAARHAALPAPPAPVHGEVGALLLAALADSQRRRRVPGAAAARATSRRSRPPCGSRGRARSWRCSRRARGRRRGWSRSTRRGRTPARRGSRSRPGVPLVPAAIAGTDRLAPARAAARRLRSPGRARRPPRSWSLARRATIGDRPADGGDRRAEGDAVSRAAARRRRRLARAPRLPRAAEVDRRPTDAGMLVGFTNMLVPPLGGRAAARGPRRLGHARGPDLPARGVRRRTRAGASSTTCCSSSSISCPSSCARSGSPARRRRLRGRRLPRPRRSRSRRGARRHGDRRHVGPRRRSSSRASAATILAADARRQRARADRARRRCASATASSRRRCRTSSRSAATRPTSSRARAASARRRPPRSLQQYGSLEAALEAGRFRREAEDLRLYRRIATLDASAPLPPLEDQIPTWAEASASCVAGA